jgi:uncharacterized protein YjbI with pentapeptide repeats
MEFADVTKMLKTKTRTPKQNKELSELLIGFDFKQNKSDLIKLYFTNLTLEGIVFDNAILTKCNFEHATLTKCSFKHAKLDECRFNNATFNECSFSSATIKNCEYNDAILEGTDFQDTKMWSTSFYNAFLKDTRFNRSNMSEISFEYAILLKANFNNVTFDLDPGQTDFENSVTIGTTFENIIAVEDDDVHPIVNLNLNHNPSTHITLIKNIKNGTAYLRNRTRRKNLLSQVNRRIPSLSSMASRQLDNDDLEYMQKEHPAIIKHDLYVPKKYSPPKINGGRKKKTRKNRAIKKLI